MASKSELKFAPLLVFAALGVAAGYGVHAVLANDEKFAQPAASTGQTERPTANFSIDTSPIVESAGGPIVSHADVLEQAIPSVVSVYTARIVRVVPYYNPMEELWRRFYGLPPSRQSNPREEDIEERRLPEGVGSGVIVSTDGYILTNNHVVTDKRGESVDEILVKLSDGRELVAEIVGKDPKTDVAVLKVEVDELPHMTLADSDLIRVGDVVFAIGNPLGVGQTVTRGIVSATGRTVGALGNQGYENFIQTDASINPGNSGGALIDARGRLIGMNTLIISQSGGNIGLGFAVPINLARTIMVSLIETGTIRRGFLGVKIDDLTSDMAEAFNLDTTNGALVQAAEENLPAAMAGIKRGDVITAIDGKSIKNASDLRIIIGQRTPGSSVKITAVRDGEEREFDVILGDLDDPYGTGISTAESLLEGVAVRPLDGKSREEYSVSPGVDGLLVAEVDPRSQHSRGLRAGMVIVEINDRPVRTLRDARELLRKGANRLWIYERGENGYLVIRIQ